MSILGGAFVLVGMTLTLIAALGVLRLPDVYTRMNAASKAASLGLCLVLAGCAMRLPLGSAQTKLAAAIVLQLITAPLAAYVIGRAAHRSGAPLWDQTITDELADIDPEAESRTS